MQKSYSIKGNNYKFTQNRELSWLQFNQRVLEEAADVTLPVLERLKFVSIFSSNLDEFFMVRVGSIYDLQRAYPDHVDKRSGLTPAGELEEIYKAVPHLIELKKVIYSNIKEELVKEGIVDVAYDELTDEEKRYVKNYYKSNIHPIISPIIIGSHHPVPHLDNKRLYLATYLKREGTKDSIGLIPIPDALPEFVSLSTKDTLRYIRIENIIKQWVSKLFGSYQVKECTVAAVTRNADISFDDDKFEDIASDFRSRVTSLLKSRDHLNVIRMELNNHISENFMTRLTNTLGVNPEHVYIDNCPLKMGYVFKLISKLSEKDQDKFLYDPYTPRWPEDIDPNYPIIDQVLKKDKLLFFPYDSAEPFLKLLSEAAEDKNVVSIKITIYRLAASSKIARILCRAAENGKQVTVMMELRARFDEANNIQWSKIMENSGCHILYGVEDFKCHSKICQILIKNKGKLQYITQIGTGNYNEKTNTMYTDLSLMTSSQTIGEDATTFFQNLLINNLNGDYETLLVSPEGIENSVIKLIDKEIEKKEFGYICIKVNSLTDCELIEKLVQASQAGVQIELIVRGICCIIPGISGFTENIHVTSIVGRFLEHARIYMFGKNQDSKIYISSADFMGRNLHHRLEIACPVYSPEIKDQIQWILSAQLQDNVKASYLTEDKIFKRKNTMAYIPCDSQKYFMDSTIHNSETFTPKKPTFWKGILQRFRGKQLT